ncbi:MAG: DUF881 domain-containing protein [Actinobacteria bacterium]|jgi:uncharacterized protein YlxW (UPF0749 family)|nr:DUF881 domain-containing protein [Actinomycetota bacterium]NBP90985.1 DUF881 domain-containing protein [Actinomycetota bacterium]
MMMKRPTSTQVVIGLVLAGLGFALATQIRSNSSAGLQTLPQADLVRILDDLTSKNSRLEAERSSLIALNSQIVNGGASSQTALSAAQSRADALEILTGQVAAHGPGVVLDIYAPKEPLPAEQLVAAINELRDAGAEVIEISGIGDDGNIAGVRVVASTYVVRERTPAVFRVDGVVLTPPFALRAIGDGPTISAALNIAGGVTDQLRRAGSRVVLTPQSDLTIETLARLTAPRYAQAR